MPFPARPLRRLSQAEAGGVVSSLARVLVAEAEPAVRRIVREERSRWAEALIGGVPFASAAASGFVATNYLVPDRATTAKAVGYVASAAALAAGAWRSIAALSEPEPAPPPEPAPEAVRQAASALVAEAEPMVRRVVGEERARLARAAQSGLPLAAGALAALLATVFIVPSADRTMKAVGYSASALLMGAGAWTALEGLKE